MAGYTRDSLTILTRGLKSEYWKERGYEESSQTLKAVTQLIDENKIYDPIRIIEKSEIFNIKPQSIIEMLTLFGKIQDRSSMDGYKFSTRETWDGIRPLSELFDKEIKPSKKTIYFDQEFINFLKENNSNLDKMHWRNFERLIAEFFNKIGYEVSLGPGSNDGGIDIRVYNKERREEGPPLILIQCKRYKKENTVEINTVKAFYSDLLFEGAERGLIATTSRIATGGKKIIEARNYDIDIAESEQVNDMVNTMWTKHFFE